mgnify:FL=1|tara:strand:- start:44 stop:490 length:447 start_codon:yes stop_codon:yes gene_type:complete
MEISIQNRNTSYKNIINKISDKRKQIFEIIVKHNGITAQEISRLYKLPINQITGRITELKDMCFIKESTVHLNHESGNYCTSYVAVKKMEEFLHLTNVKYSHLINMKKSLEFDYHYGLSEHTMKYIKKEIKKIESKITKLDSIQKMAA